MTPAEELLAQLSTQIAEMEIEAGRDIVRHRQEHEDWASQRWERMCRETAAIRAARQHMIDALATIEAHKGPSIIVLPT